MNDTVSVFQRTRKNVVSVVLVFHGVYLIVKLAQLASDILLCLLVFIRKNRRILFFSDRVKLGKDIVNARPCTLKHRARLFHHILCLTLAFFQLFVKHLFGIAFFDL